MAQYVCDYAWARPNPQAVRAAGFVAVCRYLSHDRTGKTLTRPEVDALHAAGLGVVLNFEDSAGRALGGRAAGVADAQFANQLADSLGAPHDVPIYYSVDTDPHSPVAPAIQEYVRGVVSAGGRPVGFYGGAVLVQFALANGARYGWTANASSWNHGVAPVGHMHQLYGHPGGTPLIAGVSPQAYDTSVVLNGALGAWGGTGLHGEEHPAPAPTHPQEAEEVSGTFWYPVDKFLHRVFIARADNPERDIKKGDVLHLYGPPSHEHPAGAVENMTRRYTKGLGPQSVDVEPQFAVRPDTLGSVIDGTTVDANGIAIVRWEWSAPDGHWTWHCVPYFPFKG